MNAQPSARARRSQCGLAMVEFAIVAVVFATLLFGVIEIGRGLFVWNALAEATRRGARVAAVCPIDDPAIARVAVFNSAADAGNSAVVTGLAPGNINVAYLDQDGSVIGNPGGNFTDIRYVRTRIQGYQTQLAIPFLNPLLVAPSFETVIPTESLGVPREGVVAPC